MKLPLELYSTDEDAGVGAWVLPELEQEEAKIRRFRRATNPECSPHGMLSERLLGYSFEALRAVRFVEDTTAACLVRHQDW